MPLSNCSAAIMLSAANMPLFIAVWLPLIFTLLSVPASQPTSTPPGKAISGKEFCPALCQCTRTVGYAFSPPSKHLASLGVGFSSAGNSSKRAQMWVCCN